MKSPIAIAVVLVLALLAPAESQAKTCANTYGGDVIGATRMTCKKARDVVRTWAVRYRRDSRVNRRVLRFHCRGHSDQYEGVQITCRRGRASVKFYPNVPR